MQSGKSEIVSAGMDWITVTATDGDYAQQLMDMAKDIKDTYLGVTAIPKAWGMQGYRGQNWGQLKAGTRNDDEAILIMSGELSRIACTMFHVKHERVTRADVQVTVRTDVPDPRKAEILYKTKARWLQGTRGAPYTRYISSDTGDTLYIGRRGAPKLLRFYDKSRDYGHPELGAIWRYEIEYRAKRAKEAVKTLQSFEDQYTVGAGLVWGEFKQSGFQPEFRQGSKVVAMEVGIKKTTPEGRIAWLEKCVAPVVTQMLALGYEAEVIEALGLRGVAEGVLQNGSK